MPVGFSLKLMIGRETISPSRTTANESEMLAACSASMVCALDAGALLVAALGDALGDLCERLLSLIGEVEGDVRDVRDGSKFCSGLRMSSPVSSGRSFRRKQPRIPVVGLVGIGRGIVRRRLLAQHDVALRHLLDDRALGLLAVELEEEVLLLRDGAGQELERVLVEEVVEAVVGAERLAVLLEALGLFLLRCDRRRRRGG